MISKELKDALVNLRLSGIVPTLSERISYAKSKKLSYDELLEVIFYDEWERRKARLLNTKMKKAGVDSNLYSYSWDTTTAYDRELVRRLMSLAFIESHYSVLVFGPTGVGKTFLVKHLAFVALKGGYSVTFARTDKFFHHLKLSTLDGTHDRTIGSYLRPDLLILDDFAVKEMSREEASDFYEIILERYERKSIIITSARAPEEWQSLFPDPILGNSALDRLAHSSYQILMEGESIRKQNRPQ
ncbi:MAG: ATP-binding protein [Candidatus Humimicrobiaceae bacterium]